MIRLPPRSTLFPTRRSSDLKISDACLALWCEILKQVPGAQLRVVGVPGRSAEDVFRKCIESHGVDPRRIETLARIARDRKSTRLNSSHMSISYAVFCLKKKK